MSKGTIKWEAKGADSVKVASIRGREYKVTMRPASEGIPFVRFWLEGTNGGRCQALPTPTEGIYQVLAFPSMNFRGYAKIDGDSLVDAPEYR